MFTAARLENYYMKNKTKKTALIAGLVICGFIGGVVVSALLFSSFAGFREPSSMKFQFDSATTITVVLSALSIMLTALGIIIAVVGAFGFSILRSEAFKAAAEHAREQLGEDGELRAIIETRVNALVAEYQSGGVSNSDFPNAESEYGE